MGKRTGVPTSKHAGDTGRRREPEPVPASARGSAPGLPSHLIELQRSAGNSATGQLLGSDGHATPEAGVPLDARTRAEMEASFGMDFGDVRVHADRDAAERARLLEADAFTVGNDVTFAESRYEPTSSAGRVLLAHELAHVVQQRRGSSRGDRDVPGGLSERDASAAASAVARGESAAVSTSSAVGVARQPGAPAKKPRGRVEAATLLLQRAKALALAGDHEKAKLILDKVQEFLYGITMPSHVDKSFEGLNGLSRTQARMFVDGAVSAVKRLRGEYLIGPKPSVGQWDYQIQNFGIAREWLEVLAGDRTLGGAKTIQAYDEGTNTVLTVAAVIVALPIVVAAGVEIGSALLATEAGAWVMTIAMQHPEAAASLAFLAAGKIIEFVNTGEVKLTPEEFVQIVFDVASIRYSGGGRVRSNNGSRVEIEVTTSPVPKGAAGGTVPPVAGTPKPGVGAKPAGGGGAAPHAELDVPPAPKLPATKTGNDNAVPPTAPKSNVVDMKEWKAQQAAKAGAASETGEGQMPLASGDTTPIVASKSGVTGKGPTKLSPSTTTGSTGGTSKGSAGKVPPPPPAKAGAPKPPAGKAEPGQWLPTIGAGYNMRPKDAAYQRKVSGRSASMGYFVDGVEFDGYKNGTLLDAKGYDAKGQFVNNQYYRELIKGPDLLKQAKAQVNAAKGVPIAWHVPSEEAKQLLEGFMKVNSLPIKIEITPL